MASVPSVVIAGAGLGGFQVGAALREMGYAGRIVIVGDEPYRPYHRPPLSKGYLTGAANDEKLAMRPETFYADKKIDLLMGRQVLAVDRGHHHVALDDDTVIPYEHFVFAVGARNRPLPVHGADSKGTHYLRTLEESRALKAALTPGKRVVVIGAGFIGLEVAATAAKKGLDVTVIEVADRPMGRALSAPIAAIFRREHEKAGMRFMFNAQTLHIVNEGGTVVAVETVEHERIPADVVLIGIGVQPNVEIAAAAGLKVGNGIVVNEMLQTSDPYISAVGDCAAHPNIFAGGSQVRIESVQNATDQARCVASRIVGKPIPYTSVPWFWSDQGDLKLQIVGLTTGYDQVVLRGDPNGTNCAAFCFKQGQLLGVETVNRPADHIVCRKIIGQQIGLSTAQAGDEQFDLKAHFSRESAP